MGTYKIVRSYFDKGPRGITSEVIREGLSLEDARAFCRSPEAIRRTKKYGPWFDGYDHE